MRLDDPSIAIVDVDAGIPLAERLKVAAALQFQIRNHFAPLWGIGDQAVVRVVSPGAPPPPQRPTEWRLELRKVPTIDGALGYHDRQSNGLPILYVFPELCAQSGVSWSSCASHEILEALADPDIHRTEQLPDGRIAALEVCDQVESDTYVIDGVEVSNFVTEDSFAPPTQGAKYDYMGTTTQPFEIRPGGYAQVFDSSKGWQQLAPGQMSAYRRKLAELGLSRGARRAKKAPGKRSWLRRLLSALAFWR